MRGLLLRQVGVLEMVDVDDPVPSEDEVVVDVACAGVCGSDIHSARDGGLLRTPPIVMGHEFSGTVGARRVAVNPMVVCRECARCREGLDNLCTRRTIIGIQRQGGFARKVAVPEWCLVDLPAGVSIETGALVEPLAVALHAVRLGRLDRSMRVGVVGSGTIGLLTTFLAAGQAGEVDTVDLDPGRLDHARSMGPTRTAAELQGEYDVIFDAAGVPATRRASLAHLRPGGTTVWIGNESPQADFDAQVLVRTEQHVVGSAAYTHRDFADAAGLVDDRLLAWTTAVPLEEGPDAIYRLMHPTPGAPVKVLLRP